MTRTQAKKLKRAAKAAAQAAILGPRTLDRSAIETILKVTDHEFAVQILVTDAPRKEDRKAGRKAA